MKLAICTFIFAMTSLAHADIDLKKADLKKLAEMLGTKTLSCEPQKSVKSDPKYKGDDGFFKVRMDKDAPEVFDNGGDGYGFANGSVYGLTFDDSIMYMRAGDDGFQILTFDFDRLEVNSKTGKNCAGAILMDASDFDLTNSFMLSCCLE